PYVGNDWETNFWKTFEADFEKANPDADLVIEWVPWEGFWQKTVAAAEAGNLPDLTQAGDSHVFPFVPDGLVLQLDDVLADLGGPDSFSPLLKNYQSDGKTWMLPYVESAELFYYNKEMLKNAGFDNPPNDWDEMIKIAQAITDPAKEVYGMGLDYSASNATEQYFTGYRIAAGGHLLDKDGNVVLNSPETLHALQVYTDIGLKYKVLFSCIAAISGYESISTPLIAMFGEEQIAMMEFNMIGLQQIKTQYPDTFAKTGLTLLPADPLTGVHGAWASLGTINGFSTTKYPDLVKAAIKMYFEPKRHAEWVFGTGFIPGYKPAWDAWESMGNKIEDYMTLALEQQKTSNRGFDPDPGNPKNGAAWEAFIQANMVQDVVVKGMAPEEALKNAQAKYEEIYKK
ncbi:MAG: extracellular solute-binding protein, partial [Actinobacteria bacterium]|nr:extracellular solute-binding protein [Actinomycetota bacterium]